MACALYERIRVETFSKALFGGEFWITGKGRGGFIKISHLLGSS